MWILSVEYFEQHTVRCAVFPPMLQLNVTDLGVIYLALPFQLHSHIGSQEPDL